VTDLSKTPMALRASETSGTSPPKKRRTQDHRDRVAFIRYARKNPDDADKLYREIKRHLKRVRAIKDAIANAMPGTAMLYVQQLVLGNPGHSPDEHAQWLKDAIAGAEPDSPMAAIGRALETIGIEAAIEEVLLQEAQSIQFMNEDCLPDEPVTARVLREITGRAPKPRAVQ
jgi:hypothetical protein